VYPTASATITATKRKPPTAIEVPVNGRNRSAIAKNAATGRRFRPRARADPKPVFGVAAVEVSRECAAEDRRDTGKREPDRRDCADNRVEEGVVGVHAWASPAVEIHLVGVMHLATPRSRRRRPPEPIVYDAAVSLISMTEQEAIHVADVSEGSAATRRRSRARR